MMRNFLKKITHPFLKLGLNLYYSKPRKYNYQDIYVLVHPEVFPPHLTLSTKILLDFIDPLDLRQTTFLELGCGSGVISILAAKKLANVTATDINEKALEFLKKNAEKNNVHLQILNSDLFTELKGYSFDYIIINPPYYPKKPKNTKEQAWFCGENFEYFEKLFFQLPDFITHKNATIMILSQDCDIKRIMSIAAKNNLVLTAIYEKKVMGEINHIFEINLVKKD